LDCIVSGWWILNHYFTNSAYAAGGIIRQGLYTKWIKAIVVIFVCISWVEKIDANEIENNPIESLHMAFPLESRSHLNGGDGEGQRWYFCSRFYPIGFSRDDKFAYVQLNITDGSVDSDCVSIIVIDLLTDKILSEEKFNDC